MELPAIVVDIRGFLSDLRAEWPEVFFRRPPAAPPARPAPLFDGALIPAVAAAAPLKDAVPRGDLAALFRARAEFWAPRIGVTFGRVSVKDQRTLWGSCTRAGNLNFSWRLTLAPDEVLDYLVVHELAHRAQMNHSRRFWEIVERVCPEHRSHRRWLRRNARALHQVRRERAPERPSVLAAAEAVETLV